MRQERKAVGKLIANTLSNISVIGFGLAIFNQQSWCLIVASVTLLLACFLE